LSLEIPTPQGPRCSRLPKATCAAPRCEALTLCRGLRPHHVRKDRVGTWETSSGPRSRWRSRAATGSRGDRAVSEQARSRTAAQYRGSLEQGRVQIGGGERGGKAAGRREGELQRMLRTQGRDQHVTEAVSLGVQSARAAKPRGLDTFDLRQEPGAGKLHAGICGGGVGQPAPLPDVRQAKLVRSSRCKSGPGRE
jgi:hypothetical protein